MKLSDAIYQRVKFFMSKNNMNSLCDKGATYLEITKKVNGGTNGLADRLNYYNKCRSVFK